MDNFVDNSLNKAVDDMLICITAEPEFFDKYVPIYNFEHYELKTCPNPWNLDQTLDLRYSSFIYSPTITKPELAEALRKIVRHNRFIVLGDVRLEDNLVIHLACFTEKDLGI